jgi:NhaP-type Na+/H+ or K+/H+ antiporter
MNTYETVQALYRENVQLIHHNNYLLEAGRDAVIGTFVITLIIGIVIGIAIGYYIGNRNR